MLPTGPALSFEVITRLSSQSCCTAVFVAENAKGPVSDESPLADTVKRAIARLLLSGVSKGKAREVHFDLIDESSRSKPMGRVYIAGLGPTTAVTLDGVRQAAGGLVRAARKHGIVDMTVVLPDAGSLPEGSRDDARIAEAVVSGMTLAAFEFNEFKGSGWSDGKILQPKPAERLVVRMLASGEAASAAREGAERGRIIADAQNYARTIASRPGNVINPPSLAAVAKELAADVGLKCDVLDEKQMKKLGMGGILAVGSGSNATPPRMIVLEYSPATGRSSRKGKARSAGPAASMTPLLVVGKAITFDTGGISIKPADKMGKMVFDKCGGMAVLGLMYAAAKLKLPQRIVGILAAAENHISETAYRPGDILKMYNGVTVEVTNTDAEGRLVLGDALAWGIETYRPSAVVNLATLTGGVVVALGSTMAGIMSNSDELVAEIQAAADAAGEKVWRLPIGRDQREYIKSTPADIVNSGGREGSPLQGGAFLSFFVPGGTGDLPEQAERLVPWLHLDIAGVADTDKLLPYYAKGATGWGVRTLVEWVSSRN